MSGFSGAIAPGVLAPPYVATITTGQWSGSGDDYYITVSASNVTVDAILIPYYDQPSSGYFNGPIWCVPGSGSFTIHTSAIPSDTVTVLVQFVGILGEAQYQVLADVYSTSQAVAKADIVDNLTNGSTKPVSSGGVYNALNTKASTTINTLYYVDFGSIRLIAGIFTGNGNSEITTGIGNYLGTVNIRNRSTGVMSEYLHSSNQIVGWDGSTNRVFTQGVEYQVFGVLIAS